MSRIDVMISLNRESPLRGQNGSVSEDTLPKLVRDFKEVTIVRVSGGGNVMQASIPYDAFDVMEIELAPHCILQKRSNTP